jgi:hypothetical protein
MAKNLKFASVFGGIVLSLSLVSPSRASINTVLSSWSQSPVVIGNATWTLVSFMNLSPTTVPVVFSETSLSGTDSYSMTLGDSSHVLTPGIYDLKYLISLSPGTSFQTASLSATLTGVFPAATVTKSFYTNSSFSPTALATLTSVNGKLTSTGAVGGLTSLYVDEIISVTGGAVASITDTFTTVTSKNENHPQDVVPEPASIAVWTVLVGGVVAFGAGYRRHRAM